MTREDDERGAGERAGCPAAREDADEPRQQGCVEDVDGQVEEAVSQRLQSEPLEVQVPGPHRQRPDPAPTEALAGGRSLEPALGLGHRGQTREVVREEEVAQREPVAGQPQDRVQSEEQGQSGLSPGQGARPRESRLAGILPRSPAPRNAVSEAARRVRTSVTLH